jgi:ELWxxDGT repeat protein
MGPKEEVCGWRILAFQSLPLRPRGFQADNGTSGVALWKSNGTSAGTFLVADIRTGAGGSDPKYLTNVNGTVFFQAKDGTNGIELWKSKRHDGRNGAG